MSTGGAAAATPSRIHLDRGATWRVSEQLFLAAKVDPAGEEVADVNLYRLFGRRQPDWYEDNFKAVNGALTGERDLPGLGMRSVLDPEWGAVADGSTDCTAAFQACLDQVASEGGGTVFVPPVTNVGSQSYRLAGTLTIPAGVVLAGGGPRTIITTRASGHAIGFAPGFCRSGLRDLTLLGNSVSPSGIGVRLTQSQFIELARVELWDFEVGIDVSDGSAFSAYNRIDHCEINRSTECGIRIHQSSNGVTITGGRVFYTGFGTGGIGIDIENARAVSISGLSIESYDVGLRLAGAACGSMTGCWMEKGGAGDDFLVEGYSESEFFEGAFSFLGNHHVDQWPLAPSSINARDFGATGDGVTDDSAALQDALDAVDARGGELYIPAGTYRIVTGLTYGSNVGIRGAGPQTTVLNYVTGSGWALASATPGVRSYNLNIRDLQVSFPAGASGGIRLNEASESLVERVVVQGPGIGVGGTCISVTGTVNGYAVYNSFLKVRCQSAQVGFSISASGSNEAHLVDCRANACSVGVDIEDANHTVLDGCAIESCGGGSGIAVRIIGSSPSLCDGTTIIGTRFENNDNNVVVEGTAANIRYLQLVGNHHVSGVAHTLVDSTTFPHVVGNTGTALSTYRVVSPAASGFGFYFETTVASISTGLFRSSNTGSGTPTVLTVSAGRSAAHALSVCTWNGSADTEFAFITAAGNLTAVAGTFSGAVQAASLQASGDLTFTGASSTVFLGDGSSAGNTGIILRKADANSTTYEQKRIGTLASGLRWAKQWDSSENDTTLHYDGSGNLLAIRPLQLQYSSVSGRAVMSVSRLACNRQTALVAGNVALSSTWGNTASVALTTDSQEHRGELTVTCQGTGIGANPTITVTFPEGAWAAAGFTMVTRNGGTDTLHTIPGQHWTVSDTTTTFVITLVGTPTSLATYRFRWWRVG